MVGKLCHCAPPLEQGTPLTPVEIPYLLDACAHIAVASDVVSARGKIAISAHMNPSIYFAMCSAANRVIGVPFLLGLLLAFRFQTGVFQILGVAMILTDGAAGLAIWLKLRSDLGGNRLAQL